MVGAGGLFEGVKSSFILQFVLNRFNDRYDFGNVNVQQSIMSDNKNAILKNENGGGNGVNTLSRIPNLRKTYR